MIKITVTSAMPLNDEKRKQIIKTVEQEYEEKIRVFFLVDETIIGGLIISDGNCVFDGSVLGKLQSVKRAIRK